MNMIKDYRLWLLLIPATAVLLIDVPVALTLLYSISAMLVVAAVSHLTRKVVFPYIDMNTFAQKAINTSTGAGLVFVGVAMIISAMILGTSIWLSH